jgi:hypothetical protein
MHKKEWVSFEATWVQEGRKRERERKDDVYIPSLTD